MWGRSISALHGIHFYIKCCFHLHRLVLVSGGKYNPIHPIQFALPTLMMGGLTVAYFYSLQSCSEMDHWPQLPVMSYWTFSSMSISIDCVTTLENVTVNWTRESFSFGCWCHLSLFPFLIGFVFIISLYWFQSHTDMTSGFSFEDCGSYFPEINRAQAEI